MLRRIISLSLALVLIVSVLPHIGILSQAVPLYEGDATADGQIETVNALNALLVGVRFDPENYGAEVKNWPDEAICNTISGKLLWDDYLYDDSSYLSGIGLEYWAGEDWYWHYDLELIQKITQDTLGRAFPNKTQSEHIVVSGEELLIMPATGESTTLSVQNYTKQENCIVAVGIAVHNYNAYNEYLGYFKAVFEENPSSVYGYTLCSLDRTASNQNFKNLKASASSELDEGASTYFAENVLDDNLETAWAEGVPGDGVDEWIRMETTDSSLMDVSAIQFAMGYQKNEQLLEKNSWPYEVLIEAEGGFNQTVELYWYTDIFILDQPIKTNWIKITILGVEEGSAYDDTCISEIQLYGINVASASKGYTVAEVEKLVADYYNEHYINEENPGKYVVFSGETTVNGDICTVVVRFQGDNATMANALVADVRVNMTTGEMFVDGALLGSLFKNQNERKIVAYTAFPESTIGTNQEVKIMFSLYADNVLVPIENYMIDFSKSGVLEQIGSVDSEGSRIITFKGLGPGTVDVNFTDIDTNAAKKLSITVEDQCNYFRCSAFPIPDESIGSIYIADYSCKANENGTHDISFNAYNASYAYGVVEVYSGDGLLIRCEPLEPKSDGSGMEKVANGFKWVWEDIKDLFDGDTAFYKKDKNAKHTPVNLKNVPENAEIIITSDGEASGFATLYTGVDVFVRTVFAASSIDLKTEGQVKTVKELMSALVDALIKSISHDEIEGGIKEGLIKEATKNISTSIAYASSVDSITEIYQTVSNLFRDLDIDAKGIMLNVLKGMGYGVADTLFTTAVPYYKIVNFVDLVLETAWPLVDYDFNVGRGKMEIHVCKHGLQNYVANNSVTITQQSEFSVATILDAYIVEADDESIPLEEPIAEEMTHFEVYNITLRTNGVEVQPDGNIEVRLPVPAGVDGKNCVVYRIEDDGGKTLLPSTYQDGFVTFTTSHLSYYIVGEPVDTDITNELDDHFNSNILYIASAVLVLILVAVLFCRKKAKTNIAAN